MSRLFIIIIALTTIASVTAFSGNSTNYKLQDAQLGNLFFNSTDEYIVHASFFKQPVNLNASSTNYLYCEGYYCLYITPLVIIPSGGAPGVGPAKPLKCAEDEVLMQIGGIQVCVKKELVEAEKIARDIMFLIFILNLILLLVYLERRRKRKQLEWKLKQYKL